MHFNLLSSLKDFNSFDCKGHRGHSVSRPVHQSSESQSVHKPVEYCFNHAASHLARQLANGWVRKPANQTTSQQVLLMQSSRGEHQSTRSHPSAYTAGKELIILLDHQSTRSKKKTLVNWTSLCPHTQVKWVFLTQIHIITNVMDHAS